MAYVCSYYCKCGIEWEKFWKGEPWFGDYTIACKGCGRKLWPDHFHEIHRTTPVGHNVD